MSTSSSWRMDAVVQLLIALPVIITVCTLAVLGRELPQTINDMAFAVIGFYFGARGSTAVRGAMLAANTPPPP